MTNEEPPAPASLPGSQKPQRKAPTIDLQATEVEGPAQDPAGTGAAAGSADAAGSVSGDERASGNKQPWYNNTSIWLGAAAGASAGACIYLLLQVATPFGPPPNADVSGLDARLAQIEARLRDASPAAASADQKRLDDLASRIAKLEAGVLATRSSPDAAAANRLATIEGELRALSESVGILGRRSDEAAVQLADLSQKVTPSGADALRKLDGEFQNALSRLATVESAQKGMQTELAKQESGGNPDRGGRFAIAATALAAAIERGQPFAPELAVVKPLAADRAPLNALEPFAATGLASAATLARELMALMPQLLAAAGGPARDGSFLEKLQANAEKLIRIRPLDEAQGSDPADVVARIDMKASKGDVSGALAELESLPPAVRAPAEPWIKKAHDRLAAIEASRRLAADAVAGLIK